MRILYEKFRDLSRVIYRSGENNTATELVTVIHRTTNSTLAINVIKDFFEMRFQNIFCFR